MGQRQLGTLESGSVEKLQFGSSLPPDDEIQARTREKTAEIDQQKGVAFNHDNARPLATQQILRDWLGSVR
ncbi:hypothetical protein EVAR_10096_1 [Eumeta japonica]|uniref:Uncharacterized protein n=1 Tax=Eumeta variegata TaxID=151549 RepID=A0A4C1UC09_EUMVA|nr:hypothetical protein EVAR_10096_1 [Eumeta japonica]